MSVYFHGLQRKSKLKSGNHLEIHKYFYVLMHMQKLKCAPQSKCLSYAYVRGYYAYNMVLVEFSKLESLKHLGNQTYRPSIFKVTAISISIFLMDILAQLYFFHTVIMLTLSMQETMYLSISVCSTRKIVKYIVFYDPAKPHESIVV